MLFEDGAFLWVLDMAFHGHGAFAGHQADQSVQQTEQIDVVRVMVARATDDAFHTT